jgi:hypothetical protein
VEDSDRERLALEALLKEIERLRVTIKDWFYPQEQFFGFAVAVMGGVLAFGLTSKDAVVLTVAPAIFFIIYGHMLQVNTEVLSRAGHLRCLEEAANQQLERLIFLDEAYVGPSRQGRTRFGRAGVMLFQGSLGLLLLLVTILGGFAAARVANWAVWLYGTGAAVATTMLIVLLKELSCAYSKGYVAASNAQPFSKSVTAPPFSPLISLQRAAVERPGMQADTSLKIDE